MDSAALVRFLRRYPWADRQFLARVFPQALPESDLAASSDVQVVDVAGVGRCFAVPSEPPSSLACIWRWRLARAFALETMGREAVLGGISPGFAADGEFWWQGRWWRIWADLGSCAPEALPLSRRPPEQFGQGVRDVVVTTRAQRLGLLAAQVEQHFSGPARVTVWLFGSERYQLACPKRRAFLEFPGYTPAQIQELLETRGRKTGKEDPSCRVAAELSPAAWDLLIRVGNNPLLRAEELAFLLAGSVEDFESIRRRITHLIALELLFASYADGQPRLALAPPALALLAQYWGAAQEDLARFLPWPQHMDGGAAFYSLEHLEAIGMHTRLVRQFALALKDGSRRLSGDAGGLEVDLETMVGSRVIYREPESGAFDWVAPDATLRVAFWKMVRGEDDLDRRVVERAFTIFLEVDRATNSIPRLAARLDKYARVWASLEQEQQARLVWVIDGTPWREQKILEKMRACKIGGCTVTLDRLCLSPDEAWWQAHPAPGLSVEHAAVGGMAPLRPVWRSARQPGMQPFLGYQPWKGARFARTGAPGAEGRRI